MKKIAVLTATIAAAFSAHGQEKITFDDHVMPIFRNACLNCHNPDKKKAGLDLSTYQATLQGSENGKVVQSGNAAASLLYKCISGKEEPKMPPKGDQLNEAELAIMQKWIAGQLLENATGKAIAVANNNVQVAVVSLDRPDGPPPMPGDLPLEPYVRTRASNALTALAVSPWAPLAAVGGQKQVILYNTDTLAPLGVLPFPEGFPAVIRFSRNGQLLLTGGGLGGKSGKVVLWNIKSGERVATLGNEFDQVLAADLSADQQFVALGGPTKLLKIYATKDGKLLHSIKKHTDWVTAIAFSPDGRYLASADRSGGIQVWEGATGKEFNTLPGHKAMVTGLAFMPGVVASSSEDGKIALWDAKEGKLIREWAAHLGGAAWVDFTPDGRLVSCGRDKIAKVWDQTGKQLGKTEPMADIALRSALSNDRVIVGDWTGQIRVTDLTGKLLGELSSNPPALADRVTQTAKQLAEAQSSIPVLQQQLAAAEA
ncbi:MAG: c-type cytochrome domain-containing protein [Prosthecobacter sp.]|nr:c-type cytochrome domain-containing protein [Prosthecobacter sp.]